MKVKLIQLGSSKRVFMILSLVIVTAILGLVAYSNTATAADSSDVSGTRKAQEFAKIEQYRKNVDRQHRIQELEQQIAVDEQQKIAVEAQVQAEAQKAAEVVASAQAEANAQAAAEEAAKVAAAKAQAEAEAQAAAAKAARNTHKDYNTNVLSPSGLTAADLDQMAAGRGMAGLGASFIQAEKDYGINAGFLFSLGVIESGWGESSMATSKNNLFGFGSKSFQSKEACIDYVAKFLRDNYLTSSGPYYRGDRIIDVNQVYCPTGTSWSDKILSVWNEI